MLGVSGRVRGRGAAVSVLRRLRGGGVIGGVVGFLTGLLGSLLSIFAAGFVGVTCGRRCARALESGGAADGALAGLVGGVVATPVFLVGAAAGGLIAVRAVGTGEIARIFGEVAGATVSTEEAWTIYLLSLVLAAGLQAIILVSTATVSGALVGRK